MIAIIRKPTTPDLKALEVILDESRKETPLWWEDQIHELLTQSRQYLQEGNWSQAEGQAKKAYQKEVMYSQKGTTAERFLNKILRLKEKYQHEANNEQQKTVLRQELQRGNPALPAHVQVPLAHGEQTHTSAGVLGLCSEESRGGVERPREASGEAPGVRSSLHPSEIRGSAEGERINEPAPLQSLPAPRMQEAAVEERTNSRPETHRNLVAPLPGTLAHDPQGDNGSMDREQREPESITGEEHPDSTPQGDKSKTEGLSILGVSEKRSLRWLYWDAILSQNAERILSITKRCKEAGLLDLYQTTLDHLAKDLDQDHRWAREVAQWEWEK